MKTPTMHSLVAILLLIVSISWLARESFADKAKRFQFLATPQLFYAVPFGSNFKVDCTTNDPNATTALYHRGSNAWNLLSPSPGKLVKSGQVYTILDFGIPNAGQYKCRATNASGTTIEWPIPANAIPNPNLVPPLHIDPIHAVVLTTGQSDNVTCSSASSSTLRWFRKLSDGSEVALPSDKVYSETNSYLNKLKLVLMFKNVEKSEAGTYVCKMTYQGKKDFKYSTLDVYEREAPTLISSSGTPLLTTPSTSQTLYCKARGFPRPEIYWHKDGKQIEISGCRISLLNKFCQDNKYRLAFTPITKHTQVRASLTIYDVQFPADQGRYSCVAVNSQGKANTTINVQTKRFQFLATPQMFYAVPFGSNFKVDCTTNDPNATTALYHRGSMGSNAWKLLSPSPGKLVKSGQVYTILDFGIPNAGQYKCRATNASGITIRWDRPCTLIPNPNLVPPLHIDPIHAVVLTTGQSYNVTCSSVSSSTLRWFRKLSDGSEVALPSDKVYSETNSYLNKLKLVLMFKNVEKSEAGTYVCKMTYQGRRNIIYSTLDVYEREAPTLLASSGTPLLTTPSTNQTLYCKARGFPRPDIYWHKDGKQIEISGCRISLLNKFCQDNKYRLAFTPITKHTQVRASLTIYGVQFPADQGRYSCVAVNSQGKANTTINVQNKGSKPHLKGRTKTLSVNEPSGVVLSCSATGLPLPNITWYKGSDLIGCLNDGKPCGPQRQYTLRSKIKTKRDIQIVRSRLRISRTNKARDQGTYVCVASNSNGVAKRLYQLN